MKGLFIPEITAGMFRNGCLESIEALMAEGEIYDIEYSPWIPVSERLPDKGRWVLVTAESYQKPVEIMCYQGVRIGQHDVGNGWEDYEYPSWTSGHGDIQSHHPEAWMPLPETYKAESEK